VGAKERRKERKHREVKLWTLKTRTRKPGVRLGRVRESRVEGEEKKKPAIGGEKTPEKGARKAS